MIYLFTLFVIFRTKGGRRVVERSEKSRKHNVIATEILHFATLRSE